MMDMDISTEPFFDEVLCAVSAHGQARGLPQRKAYVPKDMLPKGYIPLCRPSDWQRYPGARDIDADALLAVETEGSDVIMEAIGFGPNNLKTMEEFVQKNRNAKPGSLKYNDLQRVKKALPYMRKLRWA